MSDTTIDRLLADFGGEILSDQMTTTRRINKAKSALYDLILKEVVGEDEPTRVKPNKFERNMTDRPTLYDIRANLRNELKAEQRNKLKELFDE